MEISKLLILSAFVFYNKPILELSPPLLQSFSIPTNPLPSSWTLSHLSTFTPPNLFLHPGSYTLLYLRSLSTPSFSSHSLAWIELKKKLFFINFKKPPTYIPNMNSIT